MRPENHLPGLLSAGNSELPGKVFPMDMHDVRYAFDETVKKAGLKNIRLHDLGKTFSTRLDEMGVSLNLTKALLGHSTNDEKNGRRKQVYKDFG